MNSRSSCPLRAEPERLPNLSASLTRPTSETVRFDAIEVRPQRHRRTMAEHQTPSPSRFPMNSPFDRPLPRRYGFAFLWLVAASPAIAAEGEAPRPKYSPTERMTPARLKAAHDDVLRIGRSRRSLPSIPGLNDYRAILHAHAEDSAHTGGTRMEMLAEAKRAGVHAILLTDHYRPPQGLHGRQLARAPRRRPLPARFRGSRLPDLSHAIDHRPDERPHAGFIETVRSDGGLIFLSHIEERPDHSMEGLDGMEIYNRHADAKMDRAGMLALMLQAHRPGVARGAPGESLQALSRTSYSPHRDDIRPTTWPSGTRRRRRGGSPASPPTTAITTSPDREDGRRGDRQDRHQCRCRRPDAVDLARPSARASAS